MCKVKFLQFTFFLFLILLAFPIKILLMIILYYSFVSFIVRAQVVSKSEVRT